MRKLGKVKFFDTKNNFGYIAVDGLADDIKFDSSLVEGEALILLKDEEVEVETGANTHRIVEKVFRKMKRNTGKVLSFENGTGSLLCNEDNKEYPFSYKDFIRTDGKPIYELSRIHVDPETDLEFSIEKDEQKVAKIVYDGKKPIERFANLTPKFNKLLVELAELSPEPWDYMNSDSEKILPVLRNYLYYTFARLKTEERIYKDCRISESTARITYRDKVTNKEMKVESKVACFNTGLATSYQEEIFAYFKQNTRKKSRLDPEWFLVKFIKASDSEMKYFDPKPEWANYFKDLDSISEIFYDLSLGHDLKYEHILKDRQERFPSSIKDLPDEAINSLLDSALEKARKRVRRNYKAAVPQYYNGKIQLLLPLCLVSKDKADLALSVEKDGKRYISKTVLPLEWAYSNARLLAKPDREWLNPVKDVDIQKLNSIVATESLDNEVDEYIEVEKNQSL